ncbi:MAG: SpoVR family protein [Thermoplasmata archaeon]|nr:MAG: SpoVR family protein [Thermoplasmata archaeon]
MSEIIDLEMQLQKDVMNIKKLAEKAGLDFFPVNFEVITKKAMVEFGTYALPNRYSHWTFGKDYGRLKKLSNLGVLEILEMVLNSDPATAFLLDSNTTVEHKMVIAHVFAHCDFFKRNYWFSKTNRNMINEAKFHERRIHELESEYGKKTVEEFLDICISIQWHVDFYNVFKPKESKVKVIPSAARSRYFTSDDFDSAYPEPDSDADPESCSNCEHHGEGEKEGTCKNDGKVKAGTVISSQQPSSPSQDSNSTQQASLRDLDNAESTPTSTEDEFEERDLLKFLMKEAPLTNWQKEVLQIVHDEIIYFIPTALTKIMNEGWATYWHTELCREYLDFEDFSLFAIKHSELMASKGLNPYKVGYMIFEDVRKRWDEEFGEGAGLKKIYEVREFEDDVSFIRNYLTQDICDKCGLFLFEQDSNTGEMVITSTHVEDIKNSIIGELSNFGKPLIVVKGANYNDNRELYMLHKFDGRELDMDYAIDVMKALYKIWGRTIHLETVRDNARTLVSYNGDKPELKNI